jgi:heat shock protein HslJ
MRTRTVWVVWAVVASLIWTACTPAGPKEVPPDTTGGTASNALDGTGWMLETLNGQPVMADTQVTLNFQSEALNGRDGCNQYSGTYTVDGEKLIVNKDIVATMMACAEPVMQQASAYIAALTQAATYEISGQRMTLLDASGKALATFGQQSRDLSGTSWTVTGYNNGQEAVVSVIAGSSLTLDFGAGGRLTGSAGCNTYTATVEVSGDSLAIGPAASTRKACADPAGVMEQEAQFLQALETAKAYRMDGDQLELRTANGALAVTGTRIER